MKVNPLGFQTRKAYLIGFGHSADGLNATKDVDYHLESAKSGLLQWGFLEDEVHLFKD